MKSISVLFRYSKLFLSTEISRSSCLNFRSSFGAVSIISRSYVWPRHPPIMTLTLRIFPSPSDLIVCFQMAVPWFPPAHYGVRLVVWSLSWSLFC